MASRATWKIADYSGETATVTLTGPVLTGANFDAQMAEVDGIQTALAAITLGEIQTQTVVADVEQISGSNAADSYAQRELKMLVHYTDTVTGEKGTFTVPCPNFANLVLVQGSDVIDLEQGTQGPAFVLAVEGWALSKAGNTINIESARVVGRNI